MKGRRYRPLRPALPATAWADTASITGQATLRAVHMAGLAAQAIAAPAGDRAQTIALSTASATLAPGALHGPLLLSASMG